MVMGQTAGGGDDMRGLLRRHGRVVAGRGHLGECVCEAASWLGGGQKGVDKEQRKGEWRGGRWRLDAGARILTSIYNCTLWHVVHQEASKGEA